MNQRKRRNTTWMVSCAIALAAVSVSAQPVLADEAGTAAETTESYMRQVSSDVSGAMASGDEGDGSADAGGADLSSNSSAQRESVTMTPEGLPDDTEGGTAGGGLVPSEPDSEEGSEGNAGGDLVPVTPDEEQPDTPDENSGQSRSFQYHNNEINSSNVYTVIQQLSTNQAYYSEKSYYDLAAGKNYLTIRMADLLKDNTDGLRLVSDNESIASIQGGDIVGLLPGTCTIIGYYYDVPIMMIDYTVLDEQQAASMSLMDQYDIIFLGSQIMDQYRSEEEKQAYQVQLDLWQSTHIISEEPAENYILNHYLMDNLQGAQMREQILKDLYGLSSDSLSNAFSKVFLNSKVNSNPFNLLYLGCESHIDPDLDNTDPGVETIVPNHPDYSYVDQTDQDRKDQQYRVANGSTGNGTSNGTGYSGTYSSDSASGNEVATVQTTATAATEGNVVTVPTSATADNIGDTTVAQSNTTVAEEEKDAILTDESVAKSAATDTTSGMVNVKVIGGVIIAAVVAFLVWFFGYARRRKESE